MYSGENTNNFDARLISSDIEQTDVGYLCSLINDNIQSELEGSRLILTNEKYTAV